MKKPVELIFQVIFFSTGSYIARVLLGQSDFSIVHFLGKFVPSNYFVILYIVTFIISPAINVLLYNLSYKAANRMLIVFMILFSVWPTMVDILSEITSKEWTGLSSIGAYGSQWGYTIVNFALMYFIGAYQRIYGNKLPSNSNIKYVILLFINISILVGWTTINDKTGFFSERSAEEYCNPIIIGLAIIYFRIFRNIDLGSNRIINELSKGSFTVFLLHYSFLKHINIEKIVQLKLPIMLICMFVSVIGTYLFCWVIYKIYNKTIYKLVKFITIKFSFLYKDIYEGCFEK